MLMVSIVLSLLYHMGKRSACHCAAAVPVRRKRRYVASLNSANINKLNAHQHVGFRSLGRLSISHRPRSKLRPVGLLLSSRSACAPTLYRHVSAAAGLVQLITFTVSCSSPCLQDLASRQSGQTVYGRVWIVSRPSSPDRRRVRCHECRVPLRLHHDTRYGDGST